MLDDTRGFGWASGPRKFFITISERVFRPPRVTAATACGTRARKTPRVSLVFLVR